MLKVLKYLKKSWVSVVAIILLLCLQAYTDLALPDYTSKIVNVGIQQGGIEDAVPEAIRSSQMENLLVFTNEDGQILNYYTLLERSSMDEKEYEESCCRNVRRSRLECRCLPAQGAGIRCRGVVHAELDRYDRHTGG